MKRKTSSRFASRHTSLDSIRTLYPWGIGYHEKGLSVPSFNQGLVMCSGLGSRKSDVPMVQTVAYNMAGYDIPALGISLTHSEEELIARMVSIQLMEPLEHVSVEMNRGDNASDRIAGTLSFIDDLRYDFDLLLSTPKGTFEDIEGVVRRVWSRQQVQVVHIDCIQSLATNSKSRSSTSMASTVTRLHDLVDELGIVIIFNNNFHSQALWLNREIRYGDGVGYGSPESEFPTWVKLERLQTACSPTSSNGSEAYAGGLWEVRTIFDQWDGHNYHFKVYWDEDRRNFFPVPE